MIVLCFQKYKIVFTTKGQNNNFWMFHFKASINDQNFVVDKENNFDNFIRSCGFSKLSKKCG